MKADRMKDKSKSDEDSAKGDAEEVLDLNLIKTDPDKLYPIIYFALKKKLKEWEEAMEERSGMPFVFVPTLSTLLTVVPENIKRSTQGKLAAATQVQSAQYLKPLFKILRSRVRETNVEFQLKLKTFNSLS